MGFLSPVFLMLLAALAAPLWAHLARRRQPLPLPFSSLRYLRPLAVKARRRARFEDRWLLLVRCLTLGCLAMALARPTVPTGWFLPGLPIPRVHLLAIDATASMGWAKNGVSRFEKNRGIARQWLESLPPGERVALWSIGTRVDKILPEPVAERRTVIDALDALAPGSGSSSLESFFTDAALWAAEQTGAAPAVMLCTDNQRAAWDWNAKGFFEKHWPTATAEIMILQPDDDRPDNTAVVSVDWPAPEAWPGKPLRGQVSLRSFAGGPIAEVLEVLSAGKTVVRETVDIPAGGTRVVSVALPAAENGDHAVLGTARLSGDGYALDDSWHFAHPVRGGQRVLVVEAAGAATPEALAPAYFLHRALGAGERGKPRVVDIAAWAAEPLDGIDTLFFCGRAGDLSVDWEKAGNFAHAGGTVVCFGEVAPSVPPPWWPVLGDQRVELPVEPIATRILSPEHPLFRGVWSDSHHFPPLSQGRAVSSAPVADSRVLATLAGRFPLVVERTWGKGRILWLNTSADRSWGEFVVAPAYVALVQQAARLRQLASPPQRFSVWSGEYLPPSAGGGCWSRVDSEEETGEKLEPATAPGPGLYEISGRSGTDAVYCAVNVRREESDLRPLASEEIGGVVPGRIVSGTLPPAHDADSGGRPARLALWPWFLFLSAALFLLECRMASSAGGR